MQRHQPPQRIGIVAAEPHRQLPQRRPPARPMHRNARRQYPLGQLGTGVRYADDGTRRRITKTPRRVAITTS